jgi:UDP-N-acetylglucosamine 2-epimerase
VLREREIDLCVVAGDVNSTLAGALAGCESGVKLAHIESDALVPRRQERALDRHGARRQRI